MNLHQIRYNNTSKVMFIGYGEDGPAGVPFTPSSPGRTNTPLSHAQYVNSSKISDSIFFRINGRSAVSMLYDENGNHVFSITMIGAGDMYENTRVVVKDEVLYVESEDGEISEHYYYKDKSLEELEDEINTDSAYGIVDFFAEAIIKDGNIANGDFFFAFGDNNAEALILNQPIEDKSLLPPNEEMDGVETYVEEDLFSFDETGNNFISLLDRFLYSDGESPSGEIFESESEIFCLAGVYADDIQDYLSKISQFAIDRIRYENKYTLFIVPVRNGEEKIDGDFPHVMLVAGDFTVGEFGETLIPSAYLIPHVINELPEDESPENKLIDSIYSFNHSTNVVAFYISNGYTYIRTSRVGQNRITNASNYTESESLSPIQNTRLAVYLANQIKENIEEEFLVGESYDSFSEVDTIVEKTMNEVLDGKVYHMSFYSDLIRERREIVIDVAFAPYGTLKEIEHRISSVVPEEVIGIE